jgi:pimeloyl-ACP methyl ester carboxylesterase
MELILDGQAVFVDVRDGAASTRSPIVLLHGAALDSAMWSSVATLLVRAGHDTFAVDLPGHGRSQGQPPRSIAEAAGWLVRLLEHLPFDGATLVGFSMGGLIALEAAASAPDRLDALVLAGIAERMPVNPRLMALAKSDDPEALQLIANWSFVEPERIAATIHLFWKPKPGALYAGLRACDDYRGGAQTAARVTCPTLVLRAEHDRMTPPEDAEAVIQALPRAQQQTLAGRGHMMISESPMTVAAAIVRFLRDHGL